MEALGKISCLYFIAPAIKGRISTRPITGSKDLILERIGPGRGTGSPGRVEGGGDTGTGLCGSTSIVYDKPLAKYNNYCVYSGP